MSNARMAVLVAVAVVVCQFLALDARAAVEYTLVNLGSLQGRNTNASDINDLGQVTGSSGMQDGNTHAFRTGPNQPINPATDNLGIPSFGFGINDLGQVVGQVSFLDNGVERLRGDRTAPNQPINPATDDLGVLGGGISGANAINNLGQVVGYSDSPTGAQGFRTGPNQPINPATDGLGSRGIQQALDVNDLGQVVGIESFSGGRSFRLGPNGDTSFGDDILDLNPADVNPVTFAFAINASGQVAGRSFTGSRTHPFRTGPNMDINPVTDDLTPGSTFFAEAKAMNDAGVVVGYNVSLDRPFVFDDVNGYRDLNTLIAPVANFVLLRAEGINNHGQIVGAAINFNTGQTNAYRLDPISIPEPTGLGLLGLGGGAAALGSRQRRRCR